MIKVSDLTISYGRKRVLENVSLEIKKGGIHVFLGKNGSGKTSLFNAFFRLLKNYGGSFKGTITYKGKVLKRSQMSYLISDDFFYQNIKGSEYLEIMGGNDKKDFFNDLNSFFELPLDEYVHTYSEGMKKKISLMGVFGKDAEIYLLDEPFTDLDVLGIEITLELIKRLKENGRTIFLSTHMLKEIEGTWNQFYLLSNKSVSMYSSIDKLKKAYHSQHDFSEALKHLH